MIQKHILTAAAILGALVLTSAHGAEPAHLLRYTAQADEKISEESLTSYNEYLATLTPFRGEINLKSANAILNVPDSHYFLEATDAKSVLQDAWGNPPDENVLGMIFPVEFSPIDAAAWGVIVYYNDDGYVSDEDAANIDFDSMMDDLKSSQSGDNEWRVANGYPSIDLVGWAERPHYDGNTNKIYWARELAFDGAPTNTLNYDIRVLGRRGALVMSFVASMNDMGAVRENAPAFLDMASFNPGATYAEYQPGVDKKAAYGLAGLIGGAAIAKKTGLLAAVLLFGKKFIVLIIAGIAGLFGTARKFMSGR